LIDDVTVHAELAGFHHRHGLGIGIDRDSRGGFSMRAAISRGNLHQIGPLRKECQAAVDIVHQLLIHPGIAGRKHGKAGRGGKDLNRGGYQRQCGWNLRQCTDGGNV